MATDIGACATKWIQKYLVTRQEVRALSGLGVDRPGEQSIGALDHGVTPIDRVDISHDAFRSFVSERANEQNQQSRDER
jgi:hypothetical protein